ncbi:MAG: thioredoxin domain-containing protein [Candidatus Micrarchaeota archaeon]|nr:thioredoxin domain-containing protein [Candidatus Micrarchaeota archaeon]
MPKKRKKRQTAQPVGQKAKPPIQAKNAPPPRAFFFFLAAFAIIALALFAAWMMVGKPPEKSDAPNGTKAKDEPPTLSTAPHYQLSASSFDSAYARGSPNAEIILVEYCDFECRFCQAASSTLSSLQKSNPNVKVVYRHYPVKGHSFSQKAAEAAECSGEQGKFWEMHDLLFENQNDLAPSSLKKYAEKIGLDLARFNSCLESGKYQELVSSQAAEGRKVGISATPAFIVFSKGTKDPALEARLLEKAQEVSSQYPTYELGMQLVSINGARGALLFFGALPQSDFEKIMEAFQKRAS